MLFISRSIKADLFRLFKSKGLYISLLILVAFTLFSIHNEALGQVGVLLSNYESFVWTADNAIRLMSSQMFMLLYFSIPILVIILGDDFKNKTYKNIITSGILRPEYFIAKSISIIISVFMLVVVFYLTTFLFAGFNTGFGQALTIGFHLKEIKFVLFKFFFICVGLMLGVSILHLTRSNIAMVLAIVLSPILIQILSIMIFPNIDFLQYLDIQTALTLVGSKDVDIMNYFIGASSLYLVLSLLSLYIFEKSEL